ncbi:phosphotransferase family protein [Aspergillus mulundensis]|uniref:Aminoglycoside phosphotransferase domain-containing protein n=1 Tax=Aspergillus mulundensis TaxID=1810919 RepID=A0A3D8RZK4_9EURO|nr:Uncharacterized protein DSM5745_06142 [Aspergillus mulundensis]RDW79290.1 Uncharacterized protein DSM5745_06142 [Aspergillus mulundensis]
MRIRNFSCPSVAGHGQWPLNGSGTRRVRGLQTQASPDELFNYTSGRWIFNEHLRLAERHLKFDAHALHRVMATASNRSATDIVSFSKMAEGGFNRLFEATFNDGHRVIARLPYPATVPEHYTVASEVATLDYLRLHGITTPKVYAWSSTKANPVGAEYIVMEKLAGIPLGETWYTMTPKEQHGIMKQIVEWETRLMSLKLPASGSLYYQKDIPSERSVALRDPGDGFCIGPIAHYGWWHEERAVMEIDRGPWTTSNAIFRAIGERELKWTEAYAKPRLPYERLYREIYNLRKIPPDRHIENLRNYLNLSTCLGFKAASPLDRPVIRHPDFQPNNILVSETNEIVGLLDWQHSTILPLGLAAGMPRHFQNYGDPESESLRQPQTKVPPEFNSLSQSEQASIRETMRRRIVHFLYAALTLRSNKEHYDAIFDQSVILHQRLFKSAGTPWEGNSITLQADMIRTVQNWPILTGGHSIAGAGACMLRPFEYADAVIQETLELDARQKEADTAMEQMRDVVGVDELGWVSNDKYGAAKETACEIKTKMLQASDTPADLTASRDHFPFDDFDEDS